MPDVDRTDLMSAYSPPFVSCCTIHDLPGFYF